MSKVGEVFFCPGADDDAPSADRLPDADVFHAEFAGDAAAGEGIIKRITREVRPPVLTGGGMGGTDIDAGGTFATHGGFYGLTGCNFGTGQYRRNPESGAEITGNQKGALTYPAEAGTRGDGLMREGGGKGGGILVVSGAEAHGIAAVTPDEFDGGMAEHIEEAVDAHVFIVVGTGGAVLNFRNGTWFQGNADGYAGGEVVADIRGYGLKVGKTHEGGTPRKKESTQFAGKVHHFSL